MQRKAKINVSCVDTKESIENEPGEPIVDALSPFRNFDKAPTLLSGYDKPAMPKVAEEEDEIDSLLPKMDNLNILEDNTTGESPFSSPRGQVEQEIQEEPELVTLAQEVKENRQSYIKQALGLGQIGTLEESYIDRDEEDTPATIHHE